MKKFYLTLAVAVAATGAAMAATPQFATVEKTQVHARQLTVDGEAVRKALPKITSSTGEIKTMSTPEGNFKLVSTGIWFEGPMAAMYTDVDEAQWEVDVYQHETEPGWYRVIPYNENSNVAQLLGKTDTTPLDINTTNPEKTYFESWAPYGGMFTEFATACPEAGFSNELYGTFSDGVIEIPEGSVAYAKDGGWYLLRSSIKIVIDKNTYKDYTVSFEAPLCSTPESNYFSFTAGPDVAAVKAVFLEGDYPMNASNAAVVAQQGIDVTQYAGQKVNPGLEGPNAMYSILYVALDANGTVQSSGVCYSFIVEDDADNWTTIGNATYQEAIISELFTDVDTEELVCPVQQHKTQPGYYRLVNPYADHSGIAAYGFEAIAHDDHNHYLYINATDPAHVYLEPSVLGFKVNDGFGEAAAMSWGYLYTDAVAQGEADEVWGNKTDNVITIPAGNMRLSQTNYRSGAFLSLPATTDFTVTLPANVDAIDAIGTDSADAPVEYFNTQGIKVLNPAPGAVYIVRKGSQVSKQFVK